MSVVEKGSRLDSVETSPWTRIRPGHFYPYSTRRQGKSGPTFTVLRSEIGDKSSIRSIFVVLRRSVYKLDEGLVRRGLSEQSRPPPSSL